MRTSRAGTGLMVCVCIFAGPHPAPAQPQPEALVLIVDSSAAMNRPMGGVRRIDAVRKAIQELSVEFPGNVPLGMVMFGHRSASDCADVEIVEDAQSASRARQARFARRLAALTPRGRCSVSRALLETLKIFRGASGRALLIVGGTDDCASNPCVVAETLRHSPVPVRADVVAVGMTPEQAASLSCVGARLGGKLTAASDLESTRLAILSAALGGMPGGRLRASVTEVAKSQPEAPYVTVRQAGRVVAQLTDNPSMFQLPPGEYEVGARVGPHAESPYATVRIRPGETVTQSLTIATGILLVNLTMPRGIKFIPPPLAELVRGADFVAGSNISPARFETGAGTYALRVTLNSRQQHLAQGLTVEPGRTIQRTVEVPAGLARITVSGRRYEAGLRPFVEVYSGDRFVASYSGSPAVFQLLSGTYTARVRDSGRAIVNRAFQVKPGDDLAIDLRVP